MFGTDNLIQQIWNLRFYRFWTWELNFEKQTLSHPRSPEKKLWDFEILPILDSGERGRRWENWPFLSPSPQKYETSFWTRDKFEKTERSSPQKGETLRFCQFGTQKQNLEKLTLPTPPKIFDFGILPVLDSWTKVGKPNPINGTLSLRDASFLLFQLKGAFKISKSEKLRLFFVGSWQRTLTYTDEGSQPIWNHSI